MAGLKLVLPTSFTDKSLPVLREDPILPANGALLLADASTNTATSVPSKLKNLAGAQAATLLKTTDDSVLDFEYARLGSFTNDQVATYRTPKKGIQGIVSREKPLASGAGLAYQIPRAILDHLVDNPKRSYFYSVWSRPVNVQTPPQNGPIGVGHRESTSYHMFVYKMGILPNTSPVKKSIPGPMTNSPGVPRLDSLVVNTFTTGTSDPANPPAKADMVGNVGWGRTNLMNSFAATTDFSFVFYRVYIEDLTASGRSFETVSAIDEQLYTAAFAPGGKFAGDTVRAITTLP